MSRHSLLNESPDATQAGTAVFAAVHFNVNLFTTLSHLPTKSMHRHFTNNSLSVIRIHLRSNHARAMYMWHKKVLKLLTVWCTRRMQ